MATSTRKFKQYSLNNAQIDADSITPCLRGAFLSRKIKPARKYFHNMTFSNFLLGINNSLCFFARTTIDKTGLHELLVYQHPSWRGGRVRLGVDFRSVRNGNVLLRVCDVWASRSGI